MLQPTNLQLNFIRTLKNRLYKWPDGIKYPGFTYYPRRPDFQDEPYQPTKLFRVQRIKPVKGTPYWERNILKEFKLDGKLGEVAIVKNIPENNSRLWKIKHLIEIKPISFPNGMPTENSITQLKENGELEIKHLNAAKRVDEDKIKALDSFKSDEKRLDGDTLRRLSRKQWLSGW